MEDLSREHMIKWLRETMGEHVDFGEPMRQSLNQAADTIERLQNDLNFWKNQAEQNAKSFKREVADLTTQRDAALAEVERLKGQDNART